MQNVLIVEDDSDIITLLNIHLKDMGCHVTSCQDGGEGLLVATRQKFDLYILDVMLPTMGGIDICRQIRSKGISPPIMMLTSKSEETDKVLGLETGADDYLTKPFGIKEFISRVKAIFRRAAMQSGVTDDTRAAIIARGELLIDPEKRKVTRTGKNIDLTPKEFDLLYLLASHPGRSYSRQSLLSQLWGYEFEGYDHTVNSHINRLRAKIEANDKKPTYILTQWGVGYKFNEEI